MEGSQGVAQRDPGWGPVWKKAWLVLVPIPFVSLGRMNRGRGDALTSMRTLFLAWIGAGVWIVFLTWLVLRDRSQEGSISPGAFAAGVCLSGLLSLALIRLANARPFDDASSAKTVAASYQALFFLRMALAQGVMLLGFVGAFVTNEWWMVLVGFAFAAVGFAAAAPTSADLARIQEKVRAQGSSVDVVAALLSATREPRGA